MHSSANNDTQEIVPAVASREDSDSGPPPKGGTRMLSTFGQKLAAFLKETWNSLLLLLAVGAITAGVSR